MVSGANGYCVAVPNCCASCSLVVSKVDADFPITRTDENDRAERRFDAIVAPFNLIGNAHQVLHLSDEDDDDTDVDWDSDQP